MERQISDRSSTAKSAPPAWSRSSSDEFVLGQWEVELDDWRGLCAGRGWMAFLCPCVTVTQIRARLTPGSYASELINKTYFTVIIVMSLLMIIMTSAGGLHIDAFFVNLNAVGFTLNARIAHRTIVTLCKEVRTRFRIPGSDGDDQLKALCCGPCVVAQMAKQIKCSEPGKHPFSEPDALPAYIS